MSVIPPCDDGRMILQMRFPGPTSTDDANDANHANDANDFEAESTAGPGAGDVAAESAAAAESSADPLRISCGDCRMENTSVCDECVVTHLLDRTDAFGRTSACMGSPEGVRPVAPVVVLDGEEFTTLRMLQAAGMAPRNRHVARHPSIRSASLVVV